MSGDKEDFSRWFRRQLAPMRMTQAEFARTAGVAPSQVSYWMNGRRIPDPESCDKIADVLGVSVDEVLIKAGHRPRLDDKWEGAEGELITIYRDLGEIDQVLVLDFARYRWERAGRRAFAPET